MKSKYWIMLIIAMVIGISLFAVLKNNKNENQKINYEASKTEASLNNSNVNNTTSNETQENKTNEINITINATENRIENEEEIATFTTKIMTKDESRQKNIAITCSTLNDTLVENGATFSFCNTVGQATTSKGYEKADIFDANGKKKKGLGGGNCQVSTTLYNAVLAVPSLVVTERHAHSNKVPYIQNGKDAAVATGSYDFKFKNDSRKYYKNKSRTNRK